MVLCNVSMYLIFAYKLVYVHGSGQRICYIKNGLGYWNCLKNLVSYDIVGLNS